MWQNAFTVIGYLTLVIGYLTLVGLAVMVLARSLGTAC